MGYWHLTTQHTLGITFLATVYTSPWHVTSFMQQHTGHFWTHLVVLCSLEQEGGAAVLRGNILSSNFIKVWHSLDLWCFRDNWDLEGEKMESWWRQWSSGCSCRKRSKFPIYNSELDESSKRIFSVVACFFFQSSQLSWTHWSLNVAEVILDWQHGQYIQTFLDHDVECLSLSLEKILINPDLDHTPSPLNSRLVIALRLLAVSHWFLPNHSLLNLQFPTCCVMFMSNGRWAPVIRAQGETQMQTQEADC